jgi:hypothetical protein
LNLKPWISKYKEIKKKEKDTYSNYCYLGPERLTAVSKLEDFGGLVTMQRPSNIWTTFVMEGLIHMFSCLHYNAILIAQWTLSSCSESTISLTFPSSIILKAKQEKLNFQAMKWSSRSIFSGLMSQWPSNVEIWIDGTPHCFSSTWHKPK